MDNGPAHRNENAAQWQKGEKMLNLFLKKIFDLKSTLSQR